MVWGWAQEATGVAGGDGGGGNLTRLAALVVLVVLLGIWMRRQRRRRALMAGRAFDDLPGDGALARGARREADRALVEMFELGRELNAEATTRIHVLNELVKEADERIRVLAAWVERAQALPDGMKTRGITDTATPGRDFPDSLEVENKTDASMPKTSQPPMTPPAPTVTSPPPPTAPLAEATAPAAATANPETPEESGKSDAMDTADAARTEDSPAAPATSTSTFEGDAGADGPGRPERRRARQPSPAEAARLVLFDRVYKLHKAGKTPGEIATAMSLSQMEVNLAIALAGARPSAPVADVAAKRKAPPQESPSPPAGGKG